MPIRYIKCNRCKAGNTGGGYARNRLPDLNNAGGFAGNADADYSRCVGRGK
jgi:hypothetical protein